jgi:uncharacterized protein (DUF427 family)
MPRAIWNGVVIAESDNVQEVEGNLYFPPDSINKVYLKESNTTTVCPWKGTASYYHVDVNGEKKEDAAWYYPKPTQAASHIKDHIAFWRGVQVER